MRIGREPILIIAKRRVPSSLSSADERILSWDWRNRPQKDLKDL